MKLKRIKLFSTYYVSKDRNLRYRTNYNNYMSAVQRQEENYNQKRKSREDFRINTGRRVDASAYLGKNYKKK